MQEEKTDGSKTSMSNFPVYIWGKEPKSQNHEAKCSNGYLFTGQQSENVKSGTVISFIFPVTKWSINKRFLVLTNKKIP